MPMGIAVGPISGRLYVADEANNAILKVTPSGAVTTLAGREAHFNGPTGVAVDKIIALTSQTPDVAVQVILPTPAERAERKAIHAKLDEITRKLAS